MTMMVLVTGGTGYLGGHVVSELVAAGHDVRLLARSPARVGPALRPFGLAAEVDVVQGDMTDRAAVERAVEGADGVVHAAAQLDFSGDERAAEANVAGVRNVIGAALAHGADPIVYTSSTTVYVPSPDEVLTVDSPMAPPMSGYAASKRRAAEEVRAWQEQGAPITTFVIGGLYGPISPHREASFLAVSGALEQMMPATPSGCGVIDVRDMARLVARAMVRGRGPRHFMAGGQFVTWDEWIDLLSEAVGREVVRLPMSCEELIELGRAIEAEGTGDLQLTEETARLMTGGVPTDDSLTLSELGLTYRPLRETFAEMVSYLRDCGDLPPAGASG